MADGVTGTDPLKGNAVSSLGFGSGDIATDVAFWVVQVSVVNPPAVIVAGAALIVADGPGPVGVGVGVGVGGPACTVPPPQPATTNTAETQIIKSAI